MGERPETQSLWRRRQQLPFLPLPGALAAVLLYGLLCAVSSQCGAFAVLTAAVSGSVPAALFLLHRTPAALLAPLSGGAAILLLAPDGLSAALSLFSVVLGFTGAAAVYGGMSRLRASVMGGIGCGLGGIGFAGVLLCLRRLPLADVPGFLRQSLRAMLTAMTLPLPDGTVLPVFSPEAAEMLLDTMTPLLPAAAGSILFLSGYISTGCLRLILTALEAREDFFTDPWHLRPGKGCAAVYCGAQLFLLLSILTPRAQGLYYACCNISVLFMLPLALAGFGALFCLLRTMPSLTGTAKAAIVCLGIMLLAAGIHWLFTAAAFYGVYLSFRRNRNL